MRGRSWEREFLKLAAVWLACRWQTMGHAVDTPWMRGTGDLCFSLLGEHDYWQEMRRLTAEIKKGEACAPPE